MPKPVVAAVNGPAVGIGCSLALACDLIVASESAYLLLAFVNVGLVPDGGSSVFIPARVGHTRAFEMALLGERVDAETAERWGLINRVVAGRGVRRASRGARSPAWPPAPTQVLRRRPSASSTTGSTGAWRSSSSSRRRSSARWPASDDFVEGVLAFVEKREAKFGGA